MSARKPWMGWTLGLLVALPVMTGCTNPKILDERNALYTQNEELQRRLSECNSALDAAINSARADNDRYIGELNRLQADLQAAQLKKTGFEGIEGTTVVRGRGTITVNVPGDVLFASGKIDLRSAARQTLDQIAGVIKAQYASNVIRVVGHTDTDPIKKSKWKDNLQLSMERSASVHRYLQTRGIRPQLMEAVGNGQWHPKQTKATSRRVEIVVVTAQ